MTSNEVPSTSTCKSFMLTRNGRSVSLRTSKNASPVRATSRVLPENSALYFNRLSKRACVEKVDARNYSQWFSPRLIFDNTPLKDIIINLERRYNIEISLSSNISPEKRLSLVVCHEPLEDLMEVMSSLMSIRYRIDGNRVLITQR